jgi:glycosyltransferase involved in cell wall biosynthesis
MVSANKDNPPRKEFQRVMEAFARFNKVHPDSAIFFHTILETQAGFPILSFASDLGIGNKILFLKPYQVAVELEQMDMARLINCFDVLLCPSSNEGFGLPVIEAQACGVPVITNNFTSMPEMIKEGITGYATKIDQKRYTPLLSYIASPDTDDLYRLMEEAYKADRNKMGEAGRQYMAEKYDIDKLVKNKWTPLLKEVEKDVYKE